MKGGMKARYWLALGIPAALAVAWLVRRWRAQAQPWNTVVTEVRE